MGNVIPFDPVSVTFTHIVFDERHVLYMPQSKEGTFDFSSALKASLFGCLLHLSLEVLYDIALVSLKKQSDVIHGPTILFFRYCASTDSGTEPELSIETGLT